MCLDLIPKGDLESYFGFKFKEGGQYVMFQDNPKENQEEIKNEIYRLILEQSDFLENYTVKKHSLTTMSAGFYDGMITYG